MKRNTLALGVAAALGLVGAAQAQNIQAAAPAAPLATEFDFNPQGVGHVLIAPYYTAAGGNFTNINIVNTDSVNGKLVKVRFRSAANSDDVFDFQLFMSPSDMWTAAVAEDPATGLATLITQDKSCTLPAGVKGGAANLFVTDRINAVGLADGDLQAWTREGYVEFLNMADIPGPTSPYSADTYNKDTDGNGKPGALFRTVKHVSGVAPCDYEGVLNIANYGAEFADIAAAGAKGLFFPSGKLFGNSTIVNGAQTQVFSSELAAIVATSDTKKNTSGYGNFSFFPQLNAAPTSSVDHLTSDPLLRTTNVQHAGGDNWNGVVQPLVAPRAFDFPDLSTPYVGAVGTPAAPITSAAKLMASIATASVSNEFYNNVAEYGGKTDWVFSMPLRRYQVAMDYNRGSKTALIPGYDGRVFTVSATPAEQYFSAANTSLDAAGGSKICVATGGVTQFDREEGFRTSGFVISPGTATSVRFCGEVSVLSVGGTATPQTPVLGSRVAGISISSNYKEGWMSIATPGIGNKGLPIVGKAYMSARNGAAAQGVAANYGLSFSHRYAKP